MDSLSLPLVAFVELQETVTDIQKLPYLKPEVQLSIQFNWVFTPLEFYELLFSKNNCLKIFFHST